MPTDSSHGLPSSSARAGSRGSRLAGLPRPLRSAPRVWLPSRRLAPSAAWSALFHADSAREVHPSELSRPPGARALPHARTHVPFAHPVSPAASGGPDRVSATSGLCPRGRRRSGDTAVRVSRAGNSLGFFPARVTRRRPRNGVYRSSSHALRRPDTGPVRLAPQSLCQSPPRPGRSHAMRGWLEPPS
jgi:hypothetical protein